MGRTLVIVLTAGNYNLRLHDGSLTPTRAGELRLDTMARLLKANPEWYGAIVGGKRQNRWESEAAIYNDYFRSKFLGEFTQGYPLEFLLDNYKCTVPGMWDLAHHLKNQVAIMEHLALTESSKVHARQLEETDQIVFVTHPDHADIAEIPLRIMLPDVKIRCQPSGEEPPYSPRMRRILLWVTKRDPFWQKPWSWPFRIAASFRENPKPKKLQQSAPTT